MTSPGIEIPAPPSSVAAALTACVTQLAVLAGGSCLVEGTDGTLLAHRVLAADRPAALLSALLDGSVRSMHAELTHRRTIGVLPGGPVVEGRLDGRAVTLVALRSGEHRLGAAWLIADNDTGPCLEVLQSPLLRLLDLLACTTTTPEPNCLSGGPLPPRLRDADQLWVARLVANNPVGELHRALHPQGAAPLLHPVQIGQDLYLLAGGPTHLTTDHVRAALITACQRASRFLENPVTAGLSLPTTPDELPTARLQADMAAQAAPPGQVTTLDRVRGAILVRHMAETLATSPQLGPDPLQALMDYDQRRGMHLVDTLRAWLDTAGDVPRASAVLNVHVNTFRYRLRRISEILGLDLKTDTHTRAVLHIQLLAAVGPNC